MTLQIIQTPSPNFNERQHPLDMLVLHYTGMQDAEIALARLNDPAPVAGSYPGPWQSDDVTADAPLNVVKKAQTSTVTTASPPGIQPNHALNTRTSRSVVRPSAKR